MRDNHVNIGIDKLIDVIKIGVLGKHKKVIQEISIKDNNTLSSNIRKNVIKSSKFRTILEAAECPVVRVINLRRRFDRWIYFMSQVYDEKLMTVLAVSSMFNWRLNTKHGSIYNEENEIWGCYAYDCKGSNHQFKENVLKQIGEKSNLSRFIQTYWSPNSIKAFDRGARIDDSPVRISSSEKACALSHISSWVGVERSLAIFDRYLMKSNIVFNTISLIEQKQDVLSSFKISGFARGRSLFSENEYMNPSPVCIILEDDALLIHQFSNRLALLLDELPRDFHFCSLGYSRPQTAPMIRYSTHIGIPTCFWYLTGYIISLHGARFLLEHLPVMGPIDTWMGMKAANNWENEHGLKLGVGVTSKSRVNAHRVFSEREDIAKVIKFRSFAALSPLCLHKTEHSNSLFHPNCTKWRKRDTDITYSG